MAGSSWTNQVQNILIVGGANAGIFLYSGNPAKGNPPIAWISRNSTDPYGNSLPATDIVSSSGGPTPTYAQLTAGTLKFNATGLSAAALMQLSATIPGALDLISPAVADTPAQLSLVPSGESGPLTGAAGVIQQLAAWSPGSVGTTIENWHSMTPLLNSWTATAGRTAPQYRLVASPTRTVEVIGSVTAPGGLAGASNIWAFPANYQLTSNQSMVARNQSTNGVVMMSAASGAGDLAYQSGMVAGNVVDFHGFFSIDA